MTPLSNRRAPNEIALELLDSIEEKTEASKWDLIKILGNDTQFRIWIDEFLLPEKVIIERRDGRNYYYTLTERGRLLHRLLKSGNMIRIFNRVSGRRLK